MASSVSSLANKTLESALLDAPMVLQQASSRHILLIHFSLIALFAIPTFAFDNQSISLVPGLEGVSALNGMEAHSGALRIEAHLRQCINPGSSANLVNTGAIQLRWLPGSLEASMWADSGGPWPRIAFNGASDFYVRAQRDPTGRSTSLEVWVNDGRKLVSVTAPTHFGAANGATVTLGGNTKCDIDFLRVYTTVATSDMPPPMANSAVADLLDLSFDGTVRDASGSASHMLFNGNTSFVPAPPLYLNKSLMLTTGVIGSAPVTGMSNYKGPLRIEGRLKACEWPSGTINVLDAGAIQIRWLGARRRLEASMWGDRSNDGFPQIDIGGMTDFAFRAQRDPVGRALTIEAWSMTSNHTVVMTSTAYEFGPRHISSIVLGGGLRCEVAFINISTTLVGLDSTPPQPSTVVANVIDLRFDGTASDLSGHNRDMSFTTVAAAQPSPQLHYIDTQRYPPLCDAGRTTVFEAGKVMTLDASRSIASDGYPLAFSWTLRSQPEGVGLSWISQSGPNPTATGTLFGTYVFTLTVTDTMGSYSQCSVTHGAVKMTTEGVVITGDAKKDLLLGPMIAFGRSPWPYLDKQQMALADAEGARQGTTYNPSTWLTANGIGSVERRSGTAAEKLSVYGVGTLFKEDFCDGGSTASGTRFIVVHYPDPETGELLYVPARILRCDSNTKLTLVGGWEWVFPSAAGLAYSTRFTNYGIWGAGVANANFYDAVLAFYNLYYRSGLEQYRQYARWLADHWITFPLWNRGYNAAGSMFPRNQAGSGLILRMWDGDVQHQQQYQRYLNRFWKRSAAIAGTVPTLCCEREDGYRLAYISHGMLFSDDHTVREACKVGAVTYLTKANGFIKMRGSRGATQDLDPDVWWTYMPHAKGTGTVVAGSTRVRISGTALSSSVPSEPSANWVFWSCADPCDSNAVGDAHVYGPVSRISESELDIGQPYEGASGTERLVWIFDRKVSSDARSLPGWFWQPYMQSIIAVGLDFARLGLEAVAPRQTSCMFSGQTMPCENAAGEMVTGAVNRLVHKAFDEVNGGVWYSRGSALCEPNPRGQGVLCDQGIDSNRTQVAEMTRATCLEWIRNHSTSLRSVFDIQFGKAFGKLGGPYGEEAHYAADFENLITPKWLGFGYGYGFASCWPAARAGGGVAPPTAGSAASAPAKPGGLLAACSYALSPSNQSFPYQGGTGSFTVTTQDGCVWITSPNNGAITMTSGASGTGSGTVSYLLPVNNTTQPITMTLNAGGQTFTIYQSGAPCTYTLVPTSRIFSGLGGYSSFAVNAPVGCSWSAVSNSDWVTLSSTVYGNGPGTVFFSVSASNGASRTATLSVAGQSFTVVQSGNSRVDFNSDGSGDVVWQDSVTGFAQIWFLSGTQGTTIVGAANLTASNPWRIVGVSDFNSDGHLDVVWQDPSSGAAQVWFLSGAQGNIVSGAAVLSTGNSWRIMSVADFNGDGKPDCIWQDPATGYAQISFLGGAQGTTLTGAINLTASNTWRIAGTGDFNSDGKPDVVWQDLATGATQIWYLGGTQGNVVTTATNLLSHAERIAAVADFNKDGRPDIVWQNPTTGTSDVWFMGGTQGATVTGSGSLSGANPWRIMGPR